MDVPDREAYATPGDARAAAGGTPRDRSAVPWGMWMGWVVAVVAVVALVGLVSYGLGPAAGVTVLGASWPLVLIALACPVVMGGMMWMMMRQGH